MSYAPGKKSATRIGGCLAALALVFLCALPPRTAVTAQVPGKVGAEQITYLASDGDDLRLMSVPAAGGKTHRLTAKVPLSQLQTDSPLLLSPDGQWAAHPATRFDDDAEGEGIVHVRALHKVDTKARSLKVKGIPMCWSPDGKQLIVADLNDEAVPQTLVDVSTGKRVALKIPAIPGPGDLGAWSAQIVTDWSPDGKWWLVACAHATAEKAQPQLYRTKSDGSEPQHLKHLGSALTARFSPDGKRILYLAPAGKSATRLFVAEVKSSKPACVSQAVNGDIGEFDFCWSPDGKRVAYIWQNDQEGNDAESFLMVADSDGKNEQVLVSVKGAGHQLGTPNWR